jgi:hypothetical protein
MITITDKKSLMVNTFKTQFSNMPEDLKELKAKNCLSLALKMHKAYLKYLSEDELKKLENELG